MCWKGDAPVEFLRENGVIAANLCLIAGLLFFSPLFLAGLALWAVSLAMRMRREPAKGMKLFYGALCLLVSLWFLWALTRQLAALAGWI